MSLHTIIEALADGFREEAEASNGAEECESLLCIESALRRAAEKLKPKQLHELIEPTHDQR